MEQQQKNSIYSSIVVPDQLPPQHSKYPWLVAQNLEVEKDIQEEEEQIFYTINNPLLSQYRCRIPELIGKRIRACFHGWVILSQHPNHIKWLLWNPKTSKMIKLPILFHEWDDHNYEPCLSSPPEDPNSILLLTTDRKKIFIYCRLNVKQKTRKKLEWTIMSYDKQLRSIIGRDYGLLESLTYCDGKIYALSTPFVIHVDILVNNEDETVVIKLIPFVKCPPKPKLPPPQSRYFFKAFLKGGSSDAELFLIYVSMKWRLNGIFDSVYLFKLDTMMSMSWEITQDLKDTMFFVDIVHYYSSPLFHSELGGGGGGYIHFLDDIYRVVYSYNIKNKTVSMAPMTHLDISTNYWSGVQPTQFGPCLMNTAAAAEGDYGESNCSLEQPKEEDEDMEYDIEEISNKDELALKFPFHILEMIMMFCVDVDYLNFRSTCKQLGELPVIRWSNITTIPRLKTYPLVSPWSMVLDKDRGFITIIDPMLGDKYLIRTPQQFTGDLQIHCSRYGWLLMSKSTNTYVFFFNPFSSDICKLPNLEKDFGYIQTFSFSAPPTSRDCTVVGLSTIGGEWHVYIYFVSRDQSWRRLQIGFNNFRPCSFYFPTFIGRDIYALTCQRIHVFKYIQEGGEDENGRYIWEIFESGAPNKYGTPSTHYYLTKSDDDQQLVLLVFMDEFDKSVQVYKLNRSSTHEWEKIDSLGQYTIYICDTTTCLCFEAKTSKMENKIYFHQSCSDDNTKIVFYSLETRDFHTFNDDMETGFGDLFKPKQLLRPHAWIEPPTCT